jgi:hypothetical protein
MVDMKMFRVTFPRGLVKRPEDAIQLKKFTEENEDFYLLLPSTVFGFNMQTKKWGKSAQGCLLTFIFAKASFRVTEGCLHIARGLEQASVRQFSRG